MSASSNQIRVRLTRVAPGLARVIEAGGYRTIHVSVTSYFSASDRLSDSPALSITFWRN
jgi:hypothetical protein